MTHDEAFLQAESPGDDFPRLVSPGQCPSPCGSVDRVPPSSRAHSLDAAAFSTTFLTCSHLSRAVSSVRALFSCSGRPPRRCRATGRSPSLADRGEVQCP
jgi:hypothetical protein